MWTRQPWHIVLLVGLGACGRCGGPAMIEGDDDDPLPEPLAAPGARAAPESGDDLLESGDGRASDPSKAHGWTPLHLDALVRYAESCTALSKQLIDLGSGNELLRAPELRAAVLDPPRKLLRVGSEGRDFEATQIAVPPLEGKDPKARGRAVVAGLLQGQLSSAVLQDCDSSRLDGVPFGRVLVRGASIEWVPPPPTDERVAAYAASCKGSGKSVTDGEWAAVDRTLATRIHLATPSAYAVAGKTVTAADVLIPFDDGAPPSRLLVSTVGEYLAFEGCDPKRLEAAP